MRRWSTGPRKRLMSLGGFTFPERREHIGQELGLVFLYFSRVWARSELVGGPCGPCHHYVIQTQSPTGPLALFLASCPFCG